MKIQFGSAFLMHSSVREVNRRIRTTKTDDISLRMANNILFKAAVNVPYMDILTPKSGEYEGWLIFVDGDDQVFFNYAKEAIEMKTGSAPQENSREWLKIIEATINRAKRHGRFHKVNAAQIAFRYQAIRKRCRSLSNQPLE